MLLHIRHRLAYRYPAPVTLGPQRAQLYPRLRAEQRLVEYNISVVPKPVGRYLHLDAEGNHTQWLYFEGTSDRLEVNVEMRVDSPPFNPFDFVLYPFETTRLPFAYAPGLAKALLPYLGLEAISPGIAAWAAEIQARAGHQTVPYLVALADHLRRDFHYAVREEGAPHAPEDTLATRRGSCRDLSVLMIAACRAAGLAARFVSGYAWAGEEATSHELHAWVEVYLPGAGWRGFDPTLGSAVTEGHVVLAASFATEAVAPLTGAYWGGGEAEMSGEVEIGTD